MIDKYNRELNFTKGSRGILLATIGAMAFHQGVAAQAQEVELAIQDATGDSEVITVTARKFGAEASRAPVAVTAITADTIERLNIQTVEDVAVRVPSLKYSSFANYGLAYIRGLGSNYSNGGLESPVAVYIDGVYQERQSGSVFDLVDLAGVQVLKGPQGTLYGRNATGGTILIETAAPSDRFEGSVSAEFGNFDQQRFQAVVNAPLTPDLALRISAQSSHLGNYLAGQFSNQGRGKSDSDYIRAKLRWSASPELDFTYTIAYNKFHVLGMNQRPTRGAPVCQVCATDNYTPDLDDFYSATASDNQYNKTEYLQNTLNLTYDSSTFSVQSITGLNWMTNTTLADQENLPPNVFDFFIKNKGPTFTNDTYLRTHLDGPLEVLVGFSLMRERNHQTVVLSGTQFGGEVPNFNDVEIDSGSIYGEATYAIGGGFKATIGGRYNIDKKKISIGTQSDGSDIYANVKAKFKNFTPRAVLSYETDDGYYYASYNRGARSGGFSSPLFTPDAAVKPETLDNFEIGLKNRLFGGILSTNLTAFYGIYKNIQVQLVDTKGTGGVLLKNAAKGKVSGGEFEADLRLTPDFNLSTGVAYLDNKFTKYPDAPTFVLPVDPKTPGLASGVTDLSHTRLPNSPKFSGFVGGTIPITCPMTGRCG